MHFIEALFHCWSQVDDDVRKNKGKKIPYIDTDDFYNRMHMFGFTVNPTRYEEIANIAFENRPQEKKALPVNLSARASIQQDKMAKRSPSIIASMKRAPIQRMASCSLPNTGSQGLSMS